MYDYNTKDQSMRMKPEGGIRNANVPECCNHITCALKNGKKQVIMTISMYTINLNFKVDLRLFYLERDSLRFKNKNKVHYVLSTGICK